MVAVARAEQNTYAEVAMNPSLNQSIRMSAFQMRVYRGLLLRLLVKQMTMSDVLCINQSSEELDILTKPILSYQFDHLGTTVDGDVKPQTSSMSTI